MSNKQLDNQQEVVTRRGAMLGLTTMLGGTVALTACSSRENTSEASTPSTQKTIDVEAYIEQFSRPLPEPIVAKEALAKASTANLWYRDSGGDGETIILVHPTNLSGHCWEYQERFFADKGYRVIAYSRRGYLGSDSGLDSDKNDAVDDLNALANYLKLSRFHLVSAAGGGAIAAGYASRFANDDRLISLTVACSLAMFEKTPDGKIVVDKKFSEFKGQSKYLLGLSTSYRDANPVGGQKWKDMNEVAMGKVKLNIDTIQPFGANSSLEEFRKIKAPTLYISGSADLFCNPVLMYEFARNTPGSKFEIMNGAGHTAFWEAPNVFNEIVLDYIKSTSTS